MTDRTFSTFERRVAAELERYAAGVVDPTPSATVAARAIASRRRGRLGFDRRWVRLALVAGLLLLALVAAFVVAGRRSDDAGWILVVGCGADPSCADGETVRASRADGSDERPLFTDVAATMRHATWTPDGRLVVATDQRDLYVSDLDGPSQLIKACRIPCLGQDDPAVSPDGTMLAYTVSTFPAWEAAGYAGSMQLVVAPFGPDGSLGPARTLVERVADGTTGANQIFGPRWSPDGRELVFWENHVDRDGKVTGAAVSTVAIDGGEPRLLTDWSLVAGEADWSPDGGSIVFATHPSAVVGPGEAAPSDLWLIPSVGGVPRQLTFSKSPSYRPVQPRFRADGSIVYAVVRPGMPEIHVLDPRSGRDEPLLTGQVRLQPEWQPSPAD